MVNDSANDSLGTIESMEDGSSLGAMDGFILGAGYAPFVGALEGPSTDAQEGS